MKRILIVYGTSYGQTLKIATFIADVLRIQNWSVDLIDTSRPREIHFDTYNAVIAGASVQASGFQRKFQKFMQAHSEELAKKPVAFFSVCLEILETDNPKVQRAERKIATDFFQDVNLIPKLWTIFAGGLPYTKYGWFTRQIMRTISKRAGGDTDTTRDFEYTNWNDVRKFVSEFLISLNELPVTRSVQKPSPLELSL